MRIMLIDGHKIAVDPRHDLIIQRGPKVYLHFIPTEGRGSDGILYAMRGKYAIYQGPCDYSTVAREIIRRDGVRRIIERVPIQAREVVLRETDEILREAIE